MGKYDLKETVKLILHGLRVGNAAGLPRRRRVRTVAPYLGLWAEMVAGGAVPIADTSQRVEEGLGGVPQIGDDLAGPVDA